MNECVAEGTIQAYFDGELDAERASSLASHLASCLNCAASARVVEKESRILLAAIEVEFATPVPTARLRTAIEAAIAAKEPNKMTRPGFFATLSGLFALSPQRALGYAGLASVLIAGAIFGYLYLGRSQVVPVVTNKPSITQPDPGSAITRPDPGTGRNELPPTPVVPAGPKRIRPRRSPQQNADVALLLPGERKYVRTIADLNAKIKNDSEMRPSLRVQYEHNLAVLDHAIEVTRDAARKNPGDPQATQFLRSAYQTKVDLMNQVADARFFNTQK